MKIIVAIENDNKYKTLANFDSIISAVRTCRRFYKKNPHLIGVLRVSILRPGTVFDVDWFVPFRSLGRRYFVQFSEQWLNCLYTQVDHQV